MTKVALLHCESYVPELLKDRILQAMSLVRFDPAKLKGSKVALKPNLLSAISPDSAVVTHPQFFRAVAEIVLDHGGRPILIESPAVASLEHALAKAGYLEIIRNLSIPVAYPGEPKSLSYKAGRVFRLFEVIPEIFDVDLILNLPKFKTHELTYMTGAVKNLFGLVPGRRKSHMKIRFANKQTFCEFLLDLYDAVIRGMKPPLGILHVMDAVTALEGRGPGSSGVPKKMGILLAGEDGIAVDYVAAKAAGLDVEQAVTIMSGFSREIGVSGPAEIEIVGASIEDVMVRGFIPAVVPRTTPVLHRLAASKVMKDLFMARPKPDAGACTLCYQCMKICPAHAVTKATDDAKVPVFDYRKCIRCYCCSEVCPEAAIHQKKGVLQWMLRL
jgi:uncharacterized protein (DUF362 family)/Pyruvate/2-oxoacid:ferredoxin oxidoreductase delta subunit